MKKTPVKTSQKQNSDATLSKTGANNSQKLSQKNDNYIPNSFGLDSLRLPNEIPLTPDNILFLQRTIGNQAVGKLIQAKLKIGQPGGKYEQEADSMAETVVNKTASQSTNQKMSSNEERKQQPLVALATPQVEKQAFAEEESIQKMEEEKEILTKLASDSRPQTSFPPQEESRSNSSKGSGNKMVDPIRSEMERVFGADFSSVNIHTNNNAVQMGQELGAQAFTHGNDIYFNRGKYNPGSKNEKYLLAHELTHTIQQKGSVPKKIQCSFSPEDASSEMIGKKFTLNILLTTDNGTISYVKGSTVTIKSWENTKDRVAVWALGSDGKTYGITVKRIWIQPVGNTSAGLYQYSAGVEKKSEKVEKEEEKIEAFKKKKPEYQKYNNLKGYRAELKRLQGLQETRQKTLNKKMIQETMFNSFDVSIKKWTDYYNNTIGTPNGWSKLDANIIKSMIFQESQMGTAGQYLYKSPRFEGDPMTRFNLMQAIDSSGAILTLMMNEMDATLASKYKINDVTKDLYKAQKRFKELKKKKPLNAAETTELAELNRRSGSGKTWDYFYWTDSRFYDAWKKFNKQPSGKDRNVDYDFWIRTGIRWIFKKRKSVSNWAEAIRAYNGSGARATNYKKNVIKRRNEAKRSSNVGTDFIPKL